MRSRRRVLQIADRQLGLITRAQALGAGLTDHQLRHMLQAGVLVAAHLGVYRLSGSAQDFTQRAYAACLACGRDALVSHSAAAGMHEIAEPAGGVHVLVPHRRRPGHHGVIVHRTTTLRLVDRMRIGPVPVTSPARTLLDIAGGCDRSRLELMTEEALRRRLATPQQLLALLQRPELANHTGVAELRSIVADRMSSGVPESVLEARMIRLLKMYGLPSPVRQYESTVAGRRVRFDLAFPAERLAIEVDGRAPHWGRDRWQRDHDRDNAVELGGWSKLSFTWDDVTVRPSYVVLAVGGRLGLRPRRWVREQAPNRRRMPKGSARLGAF